VALTLRMVAGLTVPEIARAFLVPETTMGQRITRAKAKIKAARVPYRVPSAEDLPIETPCKRRPAPMEYAARARGR
jgi:RNA polymerase sigma-70 factor, ECF subfamily